MVFLVEKQDSKLQAQCDYAEVKVNLIHGSEDKKI